MLFLRFQPILTHTTNCATRSRSTKEPQTYQEKHPKMESKDTESKTEDKNPPNTTESIGAVASAATEQPITAPESTEKEQCSTAAATTEPEVPPVEERPVEESVAKVVDHFENMTIFGNKSLNELHQIQSKKSHLSAGILFTDPSLKM